jgi:ubiquitin-protein ligase E3 A
LKEHATYKGYSKEDAQVQWFWQIMEAYPEARQRQLLSFVTGSDRVPMAGLAALKFVIHKAGDDSENIVGAATCFNVCRTI